MMKSIVAVTVACCTSLTVAGAAAQGADKDEAKKEAKKGTTTKQMKKDEMMKDMYTGGMAKDPDGKKDEKKK